MLLCHALTEVETGTGLRTQVRRPVDLTPNDQLQAASCCKTNQVLGLEVRSSKGSMKMNSMLLSPKHGACLDMNFRAQKPQKCGMNPYIMFIKLFIIIKRVEPFDCSSMGFAPGCIKRPEAVPSSTRDNWSGRMANGSVDVNSAPSPSVGGVWEGRCLESQIANLPIPFFWAWQKMGQY